MAILISTHVKHGASTTRDHKRESMMDYESAVADFLTVNGSTFIAPQYSIANEWSCPDFVAIRPKHKECFVIEMSAARNLKVLAQKVQERNSRWFEKLKERFSSFDISEPTWTFDVLVFIRKERISWFTSKLQNADDVYLWPLEGTLTPWCWRDEVRQPTFSFKQRGYDLNPGRDKVGLSSERNML